MPVYHPFLRIVQYIAAIFFSVMKFVKSNHRATLKNEHLGELICTALTNVLSRFSGTRKSNKNLRLTNYCILIDATLRFFAIFVLALQTGFEARWCFLVSASDSSIE